MDERLSDERLRGFGSFRVPSCRGTRKVCPRGCCSVGAPPFPRTSDNCECGRICKGYPRKASRLECFTEAGVLAVSVENLLNLFLMKLYRTFANFLENGQIYGDVQKCVPTLKNNFEI